jgi:anti-sigma regulatory factor (Ser/Thr protein kinase)
MSDAVAIDLPLEPESARRAREQLKSFRDSVDDAMFIDLCLLVDELIVEALHGNAESEHGGPGDIELRAECDGGRVHVMVAEGRGSYHLPSRRPEPGDPGFGLHLVQRLSDRWGIRRDHGRATVWLELLGKSRRGLTTGAQPA